MRCQCGVSRVWVLMCVGWTHRVGNESANIKNSIRNGKQDRMGRRGPH